MLAAPRTWPGVPHPRSSMAVDAAEQPDVYAFCAADGKAAESRQPSRLTRARRCRTDPGVAADIAVADASLRTSADGRGLLPRTRRWRRA